MKSSQLAFLPAMKRTICVLLFAAVLLPLSLFAQEEMTEWEKQRSLEAQKLIKLVEPLLAECRSLKASGLFGEADMADLEKICTFLEKDFLALKTWLPGGNRTGSLTASADFPAVPVPNPAPGGQRGDKDKPSDEEIQKRVEDFIRKLNEYHEAGKDF